jgi:DNA recombination protein RmuC
MDILLLIGVAVTAALLAVLVFLQLSGRNKQDGTPFLVMQQQLDALRQQVQEALASTNAQVNQQLGTVVQQLQSSAGQIGTRLDNAARVVGEVRQNLGELSKAAQQIFDVGKDIASLQDILRAPKIRGVIGELFLGDLLGQILPAKHFTLQHRFKSGETVDAVIHLGTNLVPVDSKYPLENFKRILESRTDEERKSAKRKFITDVKKHVDAIAQKYILPDEGTFPFALMYIPAENVYYETIIRDENLGEETSLSAYALTRKVIPVSPNSFYAYLQAILLGLRGLEIESSAQMIISHLDRLRGDFDRFRKEFEVIGTHLTHAKGRYEVADRRLERFGERLLAAGRDPDSVSESEEKEENPS